MIRTVLVANRAEIAHRVIRTCRDLGIGTVAVYSDADRELPYVAAADVAVHLGPAPAHSSYLDFERILGAARRTGADAIHPGYGFLSENAAFARAVAEAGLVWIGPPPEAIEAMGDKARARRLAETHGVPIVDGYDSSQDPYNLEQAAEAIGFPVLVKAVAGGGGRGMRRVDDATELADALNSARREAEAAFGDGTLILERYIERPRHIEVQVFGDTHGTVLHLGERECSIQRRHQKVVEEAPSPAVGPELRSQLGAAAVKVARAAGYVGAGTVEFLLAPDGSFFFLEMNTRLQVEHPVTEEVTGLDLVALQISVAEGRPLPLTQDEVRLEGSSIEVRVYAEDPLRDYLPGTGPVRRMELGAGPGLRVDAGYAAGTAVGPHYDSLLAKVIASGPDRATASRRLRRAIQRAWVPGVTTNLPLLREILAHPAWDAGDLDTGFLGRHGLPTPPPLNLDLGAIAATCLGAALRARTGPGHTPPGWRLYGSAEQEDTWRCGAEEARVVWTHQRDGALALAVHRGEEATHHTARVLDLDGDALTLELDGVRATWRIAHLPAADRPSGPGPDAVEDGDTLYVHTGQAEAFVQLAPRFPPPAAAEAEPGTCAAPTPGTVVGVHVAVGDRVEAGQRLVTLEAMKMEHAVTASEPGVVTELRVEPGEAVDEGMLLARIEPE